MRNDPFMKDLAQTVALALIAGALLVIASKPAPSLPPAPTPQRPIYIVAKPIKFYTTSSNINFKTDGCLHGYLQDNESILHINDGAEPFPSAIGH